MIPTEDQESFVLAQYLRLKKLPFCHINNEMYTTSWKQKHRQKMMGSAAGFPDYIVCVNKRVIGVELKRVKGGVVSGHQKHWIEVLNLHGIETRVCKGAEAAIAFVESVLK